MFSWHNTHEKILKLFPKTIETTFSVSEGTLRYSSYQTPLVTELDLYGQTYICMEFR